MMTKTTKLIIRLNEVKGLAPKTPIDFDIVKGFFEKSKEKSLSKKKSLWLLKKLEPQFIEILTIYAFYTLECSQIAYYLKKMKWNKLKLLRIYGMNKRMKFKRYISIFRLTLFLNLNIIKLHDLPNAKQLKFMFKYCNCNELIVVYDETYLNNNHRYNEIFIGLRREDLKNAKMTLNLTYDQQSNSIANPSFEKKIASATVNILSRIHRDICPIVTLNFDFLRYLETPTTFKSNSRSLRVMTKLALTTLILEEIHNISQVKKSREATLTQIFDILTEAFGAEKLIN